MTLKSYCIHFKEFGTTWTMEESSEDGLKMRCLTFLSTSENS